MALLSLSLYPSRVPTLQRQLSVSFKALETHSEADLCLAVGLFPAAQPPRKTPFSIYTKSGSLPNPKQPEPTAIAAETEEMEYESRNQMGTGIGGGQGESAGEATGYSVQ